MKTPADNSDYCANFCEENIWQLAKKIDKRCYVVFISNPTRQVAVWQQQAAPPGQTLIWDYHVILLSSAVAKYFATILIAGKLCPLPAIDYLNASFPCPDKVNPQYQPCFKLIDKQHYLQGFASDRQHMQLDQQWLSPPPSWPCIGISATQPDNLQQFIDSNNDHWGACYSLPELLAKLSAVELFN